MKKENLDILSERVQTYLLRVEDNSDDEFDPKPKKSLKTLIDELIKEHSKMRK
jgi:hypothetical protein